MLLEECSDQLNERARDYLNRIITQVSSMRALTDALLQLSKVVSCEIEREEVDLSLLVRSHIIKVQNEAPERQVELIVQPGLVAVGDAELLNLMLAESLFLVRDTECLINCRLPYKALLMA
jgi:light-regulated signal transduction histidine kinase (bacteriophytochrome)